MTSSRRPEGEHAPTGADHDHWSAATTTSTQVLDGSNEAEDAQARDRRTRQSPGPGQGQAVNTWVARGRTRLVAVVVLSALYAALTFAFDPGGYLSTDVGGKTGALAAMNERGDWSPDLGYWLEDELPGADPEGMLYPYGNTVVTADGQYVNTTSLTMVWAARPLWQLGGERAILLLPILGAVASALAAGELERRFRVRRSWPAGDGALARWVVGVSTPVVVYALDFWEHTLGLAAMAWGLVLVLLAGERTADNRARAVLAWSLVAGLCFGLAATMRQEALVYGFVAGLWLVGEAGYRRRRLWMVATQGAAMVVGTLVPLIAHEVAATRVLGESMRAGRAVGTAEAAGAGLLARIEAALVTTMLPLNDSHPVSYLVGVGMLVTLIGGTVMALDAGGRTAMSDGRVGRVLGFVMKASVISFGLILVIYGLRFVPGLFMATPLAAVGLVVAWRARLWPALVLGIVPTGIIFVAQFSSGGLAQWAGRYLLTTGLVLTVAAVALIGQEPGDSPLGRWFRVVAAGGLAVTVFGVGWRVHRAGEMMENWQRVDEVAQGDVVVWSDVHLAREAGPIGLERRWLGVWDEASYVRATEVLAVLDEGRFVLVWPTDLSPPAVPGFQSGEYLRDLEQVRYGLFEYVQAGH